MNISEKQKATFWENVQKTDSCWLYTKAKNKQGYGKVHFRLNTQGGIDIVAHRLAWVLTYGEVPNDLFVLHKCDNPPCCNPNHLFLGTHQDNMDDMKAKGRTGGREHLSKARVAALSESSREKRKATFKMINHQQGERNSSHGSMWITDGVSSKKIRKEAIPPEGWYKGRVIR